MTITKQISIVIILAISLIACNSTTKNEAPKSSKTMDMKQEETSTIPAQKGVVFFISVKNPDETEAYEMYSAASHELLTEAGATTIGKFGIKEMIFGDCGGGFFGYAEAPNEKILTDLFNSEEYKKLIPTRNKAFTSMNIWVGTGNILGNNQLESDKASLLLTVRALNPNGAEAYKKYENTSQGVLSTIGITTVMSFQINQQIAGDCPADFIHIAAGNSDAVWNEVSELEEYKEVIALREKSLKAMQGYILNK